MQLKNELSAQELILRKASWSALTHCWEPLEYSVCWLEWEKGELRAHVWKDHSCCIRQLLSGTTCFSREPRPTEKGRRSPRHNPRQRMSAICPACCREQCRRKRMTSVLGPDRETLSCQAALWLTAQLTPAWVKPWPRRTRDSGSLPFSTTADHFDVKDLAV